MSKDGKRSDYQKWYYETYTKRRREKGLVQVSKPPRKTEEEKAENYKRGAEKRRQTMLERYGGEEGLRKFYSERGKKMVEEMAKHPGRRYCLNSERARKIGKLGGEARSRNLKEKKNG